MPVAVIEREREATYGRPTTHRQASGRQGHAGPRSVENEATSSQLVAKRLTVAIGGMVTHAVGRIGVVPSDQVVWNTHVWDT